MEKIKPETIGTAYFAGYIQACQDIFAEAIDMERNQGTLTITSETFQAVQTVLDRLNNKLEQAKERAEKHGNNKD